MSPIKKIPIFFFLNSTFFSTYKNTILDPNVYYESSLHAVDDRHKNVFHFCFMIRISHFNERLKFHVLGRNGEKRFYLHVKMDIFKCCVAGVNFTEAQEGQCIWLQYMSPQLYQPRKNIFSLFFNFGGC